MKKLVEANDVYFNMKDEMLTPKQVKKKLKGVEGEKPFFVLAAERIKDKYDRGTISVAKAEMSILFNIDEFLNVKRSLSKEEVIEGINRRRKKRISDGRKSKTDFYDSVRYFRNRRSLRFKDINERFIEKFKNFCTIYLGHKERTITNQLIFIRTLFNVAIKEGIVPSKYYPFAGDKEKIRIGSGHKIGLTVREVQSIEQLELEPGTSIWHTRNVWLVAFYFAGIRISDMVQIKWDDFKDNRLFYVMNKNSKPVSLKIPDKAQAILDLYRRDKELNNGYVFPFLRDVSPKDKKAVFVKTRNATKLCNKYLRRIATLCDIDKPLSNHIARHSFGNIAGDKIHPLMLQKLYRHSDLKTTLNYQANFIHKEADEALDSVINF